MTKPDAPALERHRRMADGCMNTYRVKGTIRDVIAERFATVERDALEEGFGRGVECAALSAGRFVSVTFKDDVEAMEVERQIRALLHEPPLVEACTCREVID